MTHVKRHGVNLIVLGLLALAAAFVVQRIAAQESTPAPAAAPVQFTGVVEGFTSAGLLVSGRTVDISQIQLSVPLQSGMTVLVSGAPSPDGRIIAEAVFIMAGSSADNAASPITPLPVPVMTPEVTPEIGMSGGCALTLTYWRDNPARWPARSLTLGAQLYGEAELRDLLNRPVGADISLILARQLIVARLNSANGAGEAAVAPALLQADALLSAYPGKLPYNVSARTPDAEAMIAVAGALNDFNNLPQPGPCETFPVAPAVTPEVSSGSGGSRGVQPPSSTPEVRSRGNDDDDDSRRDNDDDADNSSGGRDNDDDADNSSGGRDNDDDADNSSGRHGRDDHTSGDHPG